MQQVGVDWKDFHSLWKNGLEALWNSAHEYPETLHFLILQNINLSYIPCYMQPINDLLIGLRTRLPYSTTAPGFPENIRILGTVVNGEGALPIYPKDIRHYGCLGTLPKQIERSTIKSYPAGYLTPSMLTRLSEKCDPTSQPEHYETAE